MEKDNRRFYVESKKSVCYNIFYSSSVTSLHTVFAPFDIGYWMTPVILVQTVLILYNIYLN